MALDLAKLRKLLSLDPNDPLSRFALGKKLFESDPTPESLKEAAEHLRFANAKAPEHLATYDVLSQVLIQLGVKAEARRVLEEGIQRTAAVGEGMDGIWGRDVRQANGLTMSDDVNELQTSTEQPPVLDYRGSGDRKPATPLSAGVQGITFGVIIGVLSLMCGKATVGPMAILIGAFFAGIWWVALRSPGGVSRSFWVKLQLVVAALALTVATLAIFVRAGEAGAGPRGLAYWTTVNQGFRYNPVYALRPWPFVAGALAWWIAVLWFARANEWRGGELSPASARVPPDDQIANAEDDCV